MTGECPYCEEPILEGEETRDIGHLGADGPAMFRWHIECSARLVIGSIAHIQGRCSCFVEGGEDDPPGVSLREGARLALAEYRRRIIRA